MDLNLSFALSSTAGVIVTAAISSTWPTIKKNDLFYILIVNPTFVTFSLCNVIFTKLKEYFHVVIYELIKLFCRIKVLFFGENTMTIGRVLDIEEIIEPIFNDHNNSPIHILSKDDVVERFHCYVLVKENSSRNSFKIVKIDESENMLKENYNLRRESMVNIICKSFWWNKEYLYFREILYSD